MKRCSSGYAWKELLMWNDKLELFVSMTQKVSHCTMNMIYEKSESTFYTLRCGEYEQEKVFHAMKWECE